MTVLIIWLGALWCGSFILLNLGEKFWTYTREHTSQGFPVLPEKPIPAPTAHTVSDEVLTSYYMDGAGVPRSTVDDSSTWGRAMAGFDVWGPDYLFKTNDGWFSGAIVFSQPQITAEQLNDLSRAVSIGRK